MRLLNINTLTFTSFRGHEIPEYIIASHRWLFESEEPAYKDVLKKRKTDSAGFKKIVGFCDFVKRFVGEEVQWLWIDTCCIDKSSSAELTESINSMFRWYKDAQCYVAYLADVGGVEGREREEAMADLKASEWFERAWTLQELLAPDVVIFVNREWEVIGHNGKIRRGWISERFGSQWDLIEEIHGITEIPKDVLWKWKKSKKLGFKEKQRWVLKRKTTRKEDMAYCLLGIFNVSMPLVYGEGRKAYNRLLKELKEKKWEAEERVKKKKWKKLREEREEAAEHEAWRPPGEAVPLHGASETIQIPYPGQGMERSHLLEQRSAGIVSALGRLIAHMLRREAVKKVAKVLEKQGYQYPGDTIHQALLDVAFRSQQVREALQELKAAGWCSGMALVHMVEMLCKEGHEIATSLAIVELYLLYDREILRAEALAYIRPVNVVSTEEGIGSVKVQSSTEGAIAEVNITERASARQPELPSSETQEERPKPESKLDLPPGTRDNADKYKQMSLTEKPGPQELRLDPKVQAHDERKLSGQGAPRVKGQEGTANECNIAISPLSMELKAREDVNRFDSFMCLHLFS